MSTDPLAESARRELAARGRAHQPGLVSMQMDGAGNLGLFVELNFENVPNDAMGEIAMIVQAHQRSMVAEIQALGHRGRQN